MITEIIRYCILGGVVFFLYFCYSLVIREAEPSTRRPCRGEIKRLRDLTTTYNDTPTLWTAKKGQLVR